MKERKKSRVRALEQSNDLPESNINMESKILSYKAGKEMEGLRVQTGLSSGYKNAQCPMRQESRTGIEG